MSRLELRNLVKHYHGGGEVIRAVDGVSLVLTPGQLLALYGPSGSGKTTLLLLSAGLLEPDSGQVLFEGQDISGYSARRRAEFLRGDVGIVFQSFHLMGGATALNNAALKLLNNGLSARQARTRARPWLDRVGLIGRHDHRPHQLSMGERQRVAIARALANNPQVLLADEPTGNLDSRRSREILVLLRDICHEREIPGLIVTHDPQAAELVDQACTLQDGILRDGVSPDLMLQ
ncbi:MAG: ABC transporter ATP-binding protein [Solirubrobacteraceae bacterium]